MTDNEQELILGENKICQFNQISIKKLTQNLDEIQENTEKKQEELYEVKQGNTNNNNSVQLITSKQSKFSSPIPKQEQDFFDWDLYSLDEIEPPN